MAVAALFRRIKTEDCDVNWSSVQASYENMRVLRQNHCGTFHGQSDACKRRIADNATVPLESTRAALLRHKDYLLHREMASAPQAFSNGIPCCQHPDTEERIAATATLGNLSPETSLIQR